MTSDLKGVRILVVEDSWHVGRALRNLLEGIGMDVAGPAATAADAEQLIAQRAPDVVVVDISLRDGELAYDLIDRLHHRGISVIVISGYALLPLAEEKAAAILQKPFNPSELLATLRQVTAQKATH
jgi:CheY-like chemotaxis protein